MYGTKASQSAIYTLPFSWFLSIMSGALPASATVAQPAEQPLRKRRVKGSIPFGGSDQQRCFALLYFNL
jgi:hypothetical protein